jgi:hypothetical protein
MTEAHSDQSITALKALRDTVLEGLLRDSPDFRTYQALSDAIALFNTGNGRGLGYAPESQRRRGRKPLEIVKDGSGRVRRFVSQREAAEQALMERGVPLTIKELLSEVSQHGAVVGGVRPQATLSSNLSQDPRFILVPFAGRLCWWLGDQPVPDETEVTAPARAVESAEALPA